jgi:hypothetical protein
MITDSTRNWAKTLVPIAWIFAASIVAAQTPPAPPAPPPSWGAPGTPVSSSAPRLVAPTRPVMPSTAGATALPAGTYTLHLTFAGSTTVHTVTITRNGANITLQSSDNIAMSGAVDVGGAVALADARSGLQLSGTAANNTASGQAKRSTDTPPKIGTFTMGQTNWNVTPNQTF